MYSDSEEDVLAGDIITTDEVTARVSACYALISGRSGHYQHGKVTMMYQHEE